jgi:hypothetical protein
MSVHKNNFKLSRIKKILRFLCIYNTEFIIHILVKLNGSIHRYLISLLNLMNTFNTILFNITLHYYLCNKNSIRTKYYKL